MRTNEWTEPLSTWGRRSAVGVAVRESDEPRDWANYHKMKNKGAKLEPESTTVAPNCSPFASVRHPRECENMKIEWKYVNVMKYCFLLFKGRQQNKNNRSQKRCDCDCDFAHDVQDLLSYLGAQMPTWHLPLATCQDPPKFMRNKSLPHLSNSLSLALALHLYLSAYLAVIYTLVFLSSPWLAYVSLADRLKEWQTVSIEAVLAVI